MQLTPRYDGPPPVQIDVVLADVAVPVLRQRRRMAEMLGTLDADQWTAASRCSGWSVQDVVAHLVGTNKFWALSIRSGLAGTPTRFLATFDPVTTPQRMIEAMRALSPGAVHDDFVDSLKDLAAALGGIDATAWSRVAEAPPGHVELRAVALHALWDGWIHERDIVLPLGLSPVEEADEVAAALIYAATLGPAFMAASGSARSGILMIDADRPTIRFAIDVATTVVAHDPAAGDAGAPRLTGPAVELLEGLSLRVPLRHDLDADDAWLLGGLAQAFEHRD